MTIGKTITVFGSGNVSEGSRAWKEAFESGFLLANAGYSTMNGGYGGTMEATAKGAKKASGRTIGVTTDQFPGSMKNEFIDQEIRKPTWRERLHYLVDCCDGYLILDGGTGTLAELLVVWEMKNKNLHEKPIVILGKNVKALVQYLKKNMDVIIPSQLYFASSPKESVELFNKNLE